MDVCAVTMSGGIDSCVLLHYIHKTYKPKEIYCLHCNYGQASWEHCHQLVRERQIEPVRLEYNIVYRSLVVDIPFLERDTGLFKAGFIPSKKNEAVFDYSTSERTYDYALVEGRNAFLFLYMFAFCSKYEIPVLFSGHQMEQSEWDHLDSFRHRTEDFGPYFIDRMNLLQEVGFKNRVRLEAPWLSLRYDKSQVVNLGYIFGVNIPYCTYSCQFYPRCGKCDGCVCRERVFKELGIKDV